MEVLKKLTERKAEKMKANIEEIKKIIKKNFRNNISWFAEEIEMDTSYVNRILNNPQKCKSDKFCNSVIKYFELRGEDFKKYIFLD